METYTEKHTNEQNNKKNKTPNDQGIESGILKACPLHQSRLAGIRGGSVELSKDKEALSLPFRHCFRGWKRGEAPNSFHDAIFLPGQGRTQKFCINIINGHRCKNPKHDIKSHTAVYLKCI